MAWGVMMAVTAVGLASGLLAKRWWVVAGWATLAAGHAAWQLLSDGTSQNSPEELVAISAVYFYAPLVGGSALGTMIARMQSRRKQVDS